MKPEQYPKLVEIDGEEYHVCFAQKLSGGDMGFCDGDMKLIGLSRDQTDDELLETFIHEVLHAAEFQCGIQLGHPRIRKLERILASVFRVLMVNQKNK